MKKTTGIYNYIPPGTTKTLNFRDVEYWMKCPLKGYLNYQENIDVTPHYWKSLDTTINHHVARVLMNKIPPLDSLISQFSKRLMEVEMLEDQAAYYMEKGSKVLAKFQKIFNTLINKYSILPALHVPYEDSGISININIHFTMQSKKARFPQTKYVILDYGPNTPNWTTTGRFWASVAREGLVHKGVSGIEICGLNIESGKLYPQRPVSNSLSDLMIHNMCIALASDVYFPSPGDHCRSCPVSAACANAMSFS